MIPKGFVKQENDYVSQITPIVLLRCVLSLFGHNHVYLRLFRLV